MPRLAKISSSTHVLPRDINAIVTTIDGRPGQINFSELEIEDWLNVLVRAHSGIAFIANLSTRTIRQNSRAWFIWTNTLFSELILH